MLAVFVLLVSVPFASAERAEDENGSMDCHEMTRLWFGDNAEAVLAAADENSPDSAVYAYFCERESDYPGTFSLEENECAPVSEQVAREREKRISGIAEFEARADVALLDAEVTALIDDERTEYLDDGSIVMYVYEWTFYDYDDLSDGAGGCDVAGHGTDHKITLVPCGEGYEIFSDEYDESDLYGVCTLSKETDRTSEDGAVFFEDGTESEAALQSTNYYEAYDPDAAAAYANKYVYNGAVTSGKLYESYYNKAYANFNDVGGDCANFTSQCIYAGGMPQVKGTAYGSDCWYYVSASDRSGTWTSASRLCAWMGKNRGVLCEANNSNIYKGSPCFHSNKSHATICVGQNSAGTHVLNSHNYDRYHVVWSYISGTVYTVQLTPKDNYTPSSQPAHTTHEKGDFLYYGAEHPHYNYYKCSVCGKTFTDRTTTKVSSCTQCYPQTVTKKTGYAAVDGVEINSRPSLGYKIGSIPEGAACTIYPDKAVSSWYYVEYKGISGYAYSGYISFKPLPPSSVWLKADKNEIAAGEKVTFTYGANNTTGYIMGIDKVGTGRIVTPTLGITTSYAQVFSEPGTYTVYVTAYNNSGSTESGSVTINVYEPVPAVPVVEISSEAVNRGESITISWAPAENAARYQYYIGEYPEQYICESPQKGGIATSCSLTFDDFSCGSYTVYVRAMSARGVKSELSSPVSFTVNEPDLLPVTTVTSNGRTYELYDCEASWTFAQSLCESLGGKLAAVTDESENEIILKLIAYGTKRKYYIGASNVYEADYNDASHPYAWVTGETFDYADWASGEPAEAGYNAQRRHYAAIDKSLGKWVSTYNTQRSGTGFILEREAKESETPDAVNITSMECLNGAVILSWDAVSEADGYCVYRKAEGDEEWTVVLDSTADTSYSDKSVTKGTVYTYTVRSFIGDNLSMSFDETAKSIKVYLSGILFDDDTDERVLFKCEDNILTLSGDVSPSAPVCAAVYDEDHKMLSVKMIASSDTIDLSGAYSAKLIWLNAEGSIAKCECAEFELE